MHNPAPRSYTDLKACQAIKTHRRIPSLETGPTSKCAPTVRAQRHMRAHTERAHARKKTRAANPSKLPLKCTNLHHEAILTNYADKACEAIKSHRRIPSLETARAHARTYWRRCHSCAHARQKHARSRSQQAAAKLQNPAPQS